MSDNQNVNPAIKKLSEILGCSEEEIKSAVRSGKPEGILKSMDRNRAQQVDKIMSDPDKCKRIMESPQAQQLIKKLFGS